MSQPTSDKCEVVALLSPSNLDYLASIFALTRMGFTILLLSTRLSTEAYVNLLHLTDCRKLVVGNSLKPVAKEVQKLSSLSSFDIVVKEEYDLERPSGPRFPYARPPNASQQLSFVSLQHESIPITKIDTLKDHPLIRVYRAAEANLSDSFCLYCELFQRNSLQGVLDPAAVPQPRTICDISRSDRGEEDFDV